jgi:transcriptional regulator with XRE-family HTH domain
MAHSSTFNDGRRLRELFVWRNLSLRTVAELAGISESHLSRIERGARPLDRRTLVLALADALRVSPADITGQPYAPTSQGEALGHSAAPRLRAVLRDVELDMLDPPAHARSLAEIRLDVDVVNAAAIASDYGTLGTLVPGLVAELNTHAATHPETRGDAQQLLVEVLHNAFYLAKDLGHGDLGWLVAGHFHRAAEALGDPAWGAVAQFVRAHAAVGDQSRERGLVLSSRVADALGPADGPQGEIYGMLNLSAALNAASLQQIDLCRDRLAEAANVATRTGEGSFAGMMFGRTNVGLWNVALAVELGEGGRVDELAREIDVSAIPSAGRQGTFYGDVARGLAQVRGAEDRAVAALLKGEALAPQRVRTSPYLRATVTGLLPRVRGQAARELRGLAYRMGSLAA